MSLAAILALADSAFPSGAFGHSFGLETAIDDGRAREERGVRAWIERFALDSLATLDAAALYLALHERVAVPELDDAVAASIVAGESRRAGAHLARSTLDTYGAMGIASPALVAYRDDLVSGRCSGIHALAFGLGFEAAGVPWRDALVAYASSALAALVSVAARAIPLGQRGASRMLWELRPLVEELVTRASAVRAIDELCAQAFVCEIDAMRHASLDGRMFGS